jgi:hypothetical protein
MNIEGLKKRREELKQKLRVVNIQIRELERAEDLQKLARMARLISEKGFTLEEIRATKTRKRKASRA